MIQKLKDLNTHITNATKDVTLKSWFPLLLYIISYAVIDFFMFFLIFNNPFTPVETYFQRIVFSNIILLSSFVFMFSKKISAIMYAVTSLFLLVYGFAQMCYCNANKSLFRIVSVFSAKEGAKFANGITSEISIYTFLYFILIVLMISIVTFCVLKFSKSPQKGFPRKFKYIVNSLIFAGAFIIVLLIPTFKSSGMMSNYGSYQAYNYKNFIDGNKIFKDNDIITYFHRDIICTIKQKFLNKDSNDVIDQYFDEKAPHSDNSKTGIFKDKNLIIVQIESLDYTGINAENCPNITRLMQEGINFENFYSSRFGDTFTFGTETAINTGLFAPSGVSLSTDYVNNSFPYSLARLFRENGYSANEYHFNSSEYYNRGVMSSVYGYENYIQYEKYADDKNQNFEIDDTLVTDNGLYNKLIENDKFLDYIVTFSAHLPYTSDDELYKEAIKRHPELEADDPDDKIAIFKAKASLTDDFVGELIDRLDSDGILDNTVIWFITDHYCSSIVSDTVNDALTSNTPCFIYAKGIDPENVDKVCNTSDILPTVLNLFGIENCGKYIGNDIFDDNYSGYAFFQNLSWITKDFYYENGDIAKNFTGVEEDTEFIDEMNETVKNRIEINNQILFNDYYSNSTNS